MEQVTEEQKKSSKRWFAPTISTLVGIVATVAVAWYQIAQTQEEERAAAVERYKSAFSNLVFIVENHIINEKSLDLSRLSRLADLKTREENLTTPVVVKDVIEKAEFNIINSQYLDFDKKEKYKQLFDEIYSNLNSNYNLDYQGRNVNLVTDLMSSIKQGNPQESSEKLSMLLSAFNKEIDDLSNSQGKAKDSVFIVFEELVDKMPFLLLVMVIVVTSMTVLEKWLKTSFRRRAIIRMREAELEAEAIARAKREMRDADPNNQSQSDA